MKNIIILFFIHVICIAGFAQRPYWQQAVKYTIDVKLDDQTHALDAFLQLEYVNNAPDTLRFIWFHIWPNAFKNDRTAFSDQLLENGRTDFYFSDKEQRGYINRLDFRINNIALKQEDHPQYTDIIKVNLLSPLAPGQTVTITTPFHVNIPANFSRGGRTGHSYQIAQWYPKPAVYDHKGWHAMPYLDQGEFYGEFGSYDVTIHVPDDFQVAATGELQGHEHKQEIAAPHETALSEQKMLHYKQDNVHDFAWFADKNLTSVYDTLQLPSGRVIEAFAYYSPASQDIWKNSLRFIKEAVRFRSEAVGEYPFNTVTVVEAKMGVEGGMEYPTITSISPSLNEAQLQEVIGHEVGHNWFYGVIASNERDHPWMDEGMNSYYDNRYQEEQTENNKMAAIKGGPALPHQDKSATNWLSSRLPADQTKYLADALAKIKSDQPISTAAADFTELNYQAIAYYKTAEWMKELEKILGRPLFDSAMQTYYQEWKFKHPYPEDFRNVIEQVSGKDLSAHFLLLHKQGALPPLPEKKKIKPAFLFSARNSDSISYINVLPAIGYNNYDKLMVGALAHNFNLPAERFRFFINPMYATNSKRLTGMGSLSYSWRPDNGFKKIVAGINGSAFSSREGRDSLGNKVFGNFYKAAPFVRLTFRNPHMRDNTEKWIEWKTYIIGERNFKYSPYSIDSFYYPSEGPLKTRYLNQLTFNYTGYRALYPYDFQFQVQQGESFYRLNAEGNHFFNYAKGGGLTIRLFAAKFGYLGAKTSAKESATYAYRPKLTAVRGYEDYTYGDYFFGRNESEGFGGQQIMVRDGGLKIRTDVFQNLQGRSDNWIAALNLNTTLPEVLPVKIPLRLFLDVGTYAEAWNASQNNSRFMYVAGLQLTLFKELLNIYAPLMMSREFRDNLKTTPEEYKFVKRISFSIDVRRFNLRKLTGNKFPF